MVPLFERCANKLVDYWMKSLDENGTAVLPVGADLSRTVSITLLDVYTRELDRYLYPSSTESHPHLAIVSTSSPSQPRPRINHPRRQTVPISMTLHYFTLACSWYATFCHRCSGFTVKLHHSCSTTVNVSPF